MRAATITRRMVTRLAVVRTVTAALFLLFLLSLLLFLLLDTDKPSHSSPRLSEIETQLQHFTYSGSDQKELLHRHGQWEDSLHLCTPERLQPLMKTVTTMRRQWFDESDDRSSGRWFYGEKYRQKVKQRAIVGNLACHEGIARSCWDRFGDDFVRRWRKQPPLATGCNKKGGDVGGGASSGSSMRCLEQDGTQQIVCVLQNSSINFSKLTSVRACNDEINRCIQRTVLNGFLHLSCPDSDPLLETSLTSSLRAIDTEPSRRCDLTILDDIVLFSASEIENLGHTLENFMNVLMSLYVSGINISHVGSTVTVIIVDQLYGGVGRYANDTSPFYDFLKVLFHGVISASEVNDKIICAPNKVITFSKGSDLLSFIFDGLEYDKECSLRGPSALHQRWNLLVRRSYQTIRISPPKHTTNILLLVRGNSPQQRHQQSNREFSSKSLEKIVEVLADDSRFHLTVADLGGYSFQDQLNMVAKSHIIIGMHGAAIAMALHMSIGTDYCCAVIEVYNSLTKFGSYRFHGNALRSMGILYKRINSIEFEGVEAADGHIAEQNHVFCPNSTESSRATMVAQRPGISSHAGVHHHHHRQLRSASSQTEPVDVEASVVTDAVSAALLQLQGDPMRSSCLIPSVILDCDISL